MPIGPNNEYIDPALVVADAFRIALPETPLHLRAILRAVADATDCLVEGARHARYEDHHMVRSYFSECREQLEIALGLLTEVENAPDPDFDAEPVSAPELLPHASPLARVLSALRCSALRRWRPPC